MVSEYLSPRASHSETYTRHRSCLGCARESNSSTLPHAKHQHSVSSKETPALRKMEMRAPQRHGSRALAAGAAQIRRIAPSSVVIRRHVRRIMWRGRCRGSGRISRRQISTRGCCKAYPFLRYPFAISRGGRPSWHLPWTPRSPHLGRPPPLRDTRRRARARHCAQLRRTSLHKLPLGRGLPAGLRDCPRCPSVSPPLAKREGI